VRANPLINDLSFCSRTFLHRATSGQKGPETHLSTDGRDSTFCCPDWQQRCSERAYVSGVGVGMTVEPYARYLSQILKEHAPIGPNMLRVRFASDLLT